MQGKIEAPGFNLPIFTDEFLDYNKGGSVSRWRQVNQYLVMYAVLCLCVCCAVLVYAVLCRCMLCCVDVCFAVLMYAVLC